MSSNDNERRIQAGWDARHLVDDPEEESAAVDIVANVLHTVPPERRDAVLRLARMHVEEEDGSEAPPEPVDPTQVPEIKTARDKILKLVPDALYAPCCPKCGCEDDIRVWYNLPVVYRVEHFSRSDLPWGMKSPGEERGPVLLREDECDSLFQGDPDQDDDNLECGECHHSGPEEDFVGRMLGDETSPNPEPKKD